MNRCLGICEMFKLKNFIMPIWWEFCKVLPVTSQHFKSKKNRRSLKLQKKCILLSTDVTSNYLQCGKILIFVYENVQLLLNCWGTLVDIFHLFKMEIDEIFNCKKSIPAHMAILHHLIKICWALWKQRQCLCLQHLNM